MTKETTDPFRWVGATLDGKYRIDAVVGEGGFGIVYRAHHLGFEQPVAVKCLLVPEALVGEERERFFAGFMAEGRLLHQLSRATAGIVQALDVGAAVSPSGKWTPYLVLEWLEGAGLERELARRNHGGFGGRTVIEAIELLDPAARALAIAHQQGVAHRDVKPANLFLAEVAGKKTIKVLDFGIAKVMSETATATRAFEVTGGSLQAFTPRYGAPEQFSRRFGATGPWTDVFAFALVLVEVIAGRPALEGEDTAQLFVAASDLEKRPSLLALGVPTSEAIDGVIQKALAVDIKDRYRTVGEFWDALLAAAGFEGDAVGSGRGPLGSIDQSAALAPTRLAAPSRPDGYPTELSSSRPLAPRTGKGAALTFGTVRSVARFLVAMLAAASAFAIVAFMGYLVWRSDQTDAPAQPTLPASEPPAPASAAAPAATSLPAPSAAPEVEAPSAPAPAASTPEKSSPAAARLSAREVPSGRTADDALWLEGYRLDQFETALQPFAQAHAECQSHGMSLCSELQWRRACELDPALARVESWTVSASDGSVLRGGSQCSDRRVPGDPKASTASAVCCDRAVAVRTEGVSASLMASAATRVGQFEKAYNRQSTDLLGEVFDDGLVIQKQPRTKRGAIDLIAETFRSYPDQWLLVESCSVKLNVVKPAPRRRTKRPRVQTWSTECAQVRYRAGESTPLESTFVWSGTGKLKALLEVPSEAPASR